MHFIVSDILIVYLTKKLIPSDTKVPADDGNDSLPSAIGSPHH